MGSLWVVNLRKNKTEVDGQSQTTFRVMFALFVAVNVVMVALTVAIIVKSVLFSRGRGKDVSNKKSILELQKMVILVAAFYCLANVPSAMVYYHRAEYNICTMDVDDELKTAQACAHVLNSGINFFIYVGICSRFRKHFWQTLLGKQPKVHLRTPSTTPNRKSKTESSTSVF